jgi:hypothetical protein
MIGAYDSNLNFIDEFALIKNWHISDKNKISAGTGIRPFDTSITTIKEIPIGIYGGILSSHYGHFLLESLSRYWAIKDLDNTLPIIWYIGMQSSADDSFSTELKPWQLEIFNLLNIDTSRFVYITSPIRMNYIYVADPGYRIKYWCHPLHIASLGIYPPAQIIPEKKIWLSRTGVQSGKIINESEIEDILRTFGWIIVNPESMSIREQLSMINDAAIISGFEGSAFHTLILTDIKCKVIIFNRIQNENYITISFYKKFIQKIITVPLTHVSIRGGENIGRIINGVTVYPPRGGRFVKVTNISSVIHHLSTYYN